MTNGTDQQYRSRKWLVATTTLTRSTVIALVVIAAATALLGLDKISDAVWADVIKFIVGAWGVTVTFVGTGYGFNNQKQAVGLAQSQNGGSP